MSAPDVPAVVAGLYALTPGPGRPTPHGVRREGVRLTDGVPVEVELLAPALAASPAARAALAAGGDALRTLNGRHVVRVLHVHVPDDGPVALVRDRFAAAVLADARRVEGGTVTPRQAVTTAVEVLSGLAEVHAAGLVHGALSERDVLMDTSVPLRTVVRVTGYGVAALLGRPVDVPLPPGARPVPQPADDVWATGVLLGQLLLGALPTPALLRGSGLPPALVAAALALLADDPADRPTAAQAREALLAVPGLDGLAALPPVARPLPLAPPVPVLPDDVPAPVEPVAVVERPVAEPAVEAPPPAEPPVEAPTVTAPVLPAPDLPPTPEPEPGTRVVPVAVPPASAERGPGRRRAAVLAAAAAATVLAVLAGLLVGRGGGPGPEPSPAPLAVAPFVFDPLTRPDGLVVRRTWTLTDEGAGLRGETVVINETDRPVNAGLDEVVPKSVAAHVDDLAFAPEPDATVREDPVVRFLAKALPPGQALQWRFDVVLPQPVTTPQGLAALAADAEQERLAYEASRPQPTRGPARVVRLVVTPTSLRLRPLETRSLTISARLSDGRVLSGGAIPGIGVSSSDPRVVRNAGGVVQARTAGRATVTARAGTVRASVVVVVVAPPPPPPPPPLPSLRPTPRPTPAPVVTSRPPAPRPRATTARPRPRPTTARPRPATTRPRPATVAPRPTTAAPRPRPTTAAPRPSPTRSPAPAPAPSSPRPRPTF